MSKKYKLLICVAIGAIFLMSFGFNEGDIGQSTKFEQFPVKKARNISEPSNLAENEDMVAAILIMPKSYLPALENFSNSKMAKDMIVLRAQIEFKDGRMTAVSNRKEKREVTRISPGDDPASKLDHAIFKNTSKLEKQIFATGIIYFLASIHKGRLLH